MDDKTYDGELDVYVSSMHAGEKNPVYYLPNDPGDFHSAKFNYLSCTICFVGAAIALVVAVVRSVRKPPRVRKVKPLKDTKIHERLSLRGLICLTKE